MNPDDWQRGGGHFQWRDFRLFIRRGGVGKPALLAEAALRLDNRQWRGHPHCVFINRSAETVVDALGPVTTESGAPRPAGACGIGGGLPESEAYEN